MLTPPEQFGIVEPGLYRSDTLHPSHFPFIRSLNLKTAILLTPELPSRAMSNFFEENQIRLIDLALGSWKNNMSNNSISNNSNNNNSNNNAADGQGIGEAVSGSGAGAGTGTGTGSGGALAIAGGGTNVTLTTPSVPAAPFQTSWWKPLSEELIKDGLEMVLDAKNYPIIVMDTSGIHEIGTFMGCLRRLQHWNFSSIIVEYRAYAGSKARYVNEQFIELFDIDWITLPECLPTWWIEQEQMWVCFQKPFSIIFLSF
ncbi:tyrosine phosphatase family-domain-containing protein [Lobosporangium transversale]|uniref:Tyrosine phosphatase family-domain-containing protein n=1 Tax=Lobosporangium transversale TaxID=64571 RepID=A0A1Y2GQP2_9FUNG|nr:tyrosine phosphatase family-domain-containing protein [Lobosporangium transversale]ORZ19216.1 tyrosine phosphatase family-domain-containing protein [Lobosporangium transversale]|eukprot:XP_021882384.1 tyrosine phosphatase family-domain-containing protein [Lobosporangium transversale]